MAGGLGDLYNRTLPSSCPSSHRGDLNDSELANAIHILRYILADVRLNVCYNNLTIAYT